MPSRQKNILKIGVTGGIGSGKSAVCSFFTRLGVPAL
ncbi:MAG: dephospho-CoA kinase, partial [Bacteroidota bacterium]